MRSPHLIVVSSVERGTREMGRVSVEEQRNQKSHSRQMPVSVGVLVSGGSTAQVLKRGLKEVKVKVKVMEVMR